jgi:hypothetical protein
VGLNVGSGKTLNVTGASNHANLAYTGTLTGGTGVINIGSGQLYKDASGNVGIGTSSPTSLLQPQVNSAGNTPNLLSLVNNTGGSVVDTGVTLWMSGRGAQADSDRGVFIRAVVEDTSNSHSLRFGTSSPSAAPTERMRIDSAGNVGIGTSSPVGKLEVNTGSSGSFFTRVAGDNGITNPAAAIATDSSLVRFCASGAAMAFRAGALGTTPLSQPERMRIDSDGNLLVGTTTAGTMSGGSVIGVGARGGIIANSAESIANNGTLDIAINTPGGGYQGFLLVANTNLGSASLRTQRTYSVFGRGTDSSIQQIATDNGASGGAAFTVTTPSNGVIRVTNTSGNTTAIAIQFFGGTSL